jgi:hypothetical protein
MVNDAMADYAFPTHLLNEIKSRWDTVAAPKTSALPDDRALRRILETSYHASLRTAELRPIRCVLAHVSKNDIPEEARLLFEHPAALTDSELVRLAPVTDLHRTLIGCDTMDGTFKIWGLFERGPEWVDFSIGSPPAAPTRHANLPPDCLTITIEAPGALIVTRGARGLVRLRAGRIILPHENPLRREDEPLGRFFKQLVDDFGQAPPYRNRLEPIKGASDILFDVCISSIASMLERIRSERHGGSIVISRLPLDKSLAYKTYTVVEHAALADGMVTYCEALGSLLDDSKPSSGRSSELKKCRAEATVRSASERLARGINRFSLLATVDGAVLLDGTLQIEGFGVRFPVLLPPGTTILDALNGSEYACDEWGLRHQSVFSVCQQCEDAVGLIVSQDGDVKAIKSVDSRLFLWDGLLD